MSAVWRDNYPYRSRHGGAKKNLFRSMRSGLFGSGTTFGDKPAPEILYPDFAPREIRPGEMRAADANVTEEQDIQPAEDRMRLDACNGALDHLARNAVVQSIQLVNQELKRLRSLIDESGADDPHLPDAEEELLGCSTVATELQQRNRREIVQQYATLRRIDCRLVASPSPGPRPDDASSWLDMMNDGRPPARRPLNPRR